MRALRVPAWFVLPAFVCASGWAATGVGFGAAALPTFCATSAGPAAPLGATLDLALVLNPPSLLVVGWMSMVAAMMVPMLVLPLRHVYERSFVSRRVRRMLLFVAGYAAVWIAAATILLPLALILVWGMHSAALVVITAFALLWQVSPAKQFFLNRCCRRPALAAFRVMAETAAFKYGITHALACVGACWALMLLPLAITHGHELAMLLVGLFVGLERLERPAALKWGWRGPRTALRIVATRMQSASLL